MELGVITVCLVVVFAIGYALGYTVGHGRGRAGAMAELRKRKTP